MGFKHTISLRAAAFSCSFRFAEICGSNVIPDQKTQTDNRHNRWETSHTVILAGTSTFLLFSATTENLMTFNSTHHYLTGLNAEMTSLFMNISKAGVMRGTADTSHWVVLLLPCGLFHTTKPTCILLAFYVIQQHKVDHNCEAEGK